MPPIQPPPFSVRANGPQGHIDADFPESARFGLLHLVYDLVDKGYVAGWPTIARELERLARIAPTEYGRTTAEKERAQQTAQTLLESLPWPKVYDFCERLHNHLSSEVGYPDEDGDYQVVFSLSEVQKAVSDDLQNLFVEEGLAYEFVGGHVRRRGRKHTVEQALRAEVVLGDPRLASARKHYGKALQFIRHPSKPDYENAIKEAVCAVEAAGKVLFADAKAATLGELVKWLASDTGIQLPKSIALTFNGAYAFRSGGEGVSHGASNGGVATSELAEYILALCASQIIYLVDLAKAHEDDIPF